MLLGGVAFWSGEVALLCELHGKAVDELPLKVEPPRCLFTRMAALHQKSVSPPSLGRGRAQSCIAPNDGQGHARDRVLAGSTFEPTIYLYIYWRADRRHYIVHRRGYEHKTAKTLNEAVRVAMNLFGCAQEDLLKVAFVGVKRRPAASKSSSSSLESLGSDDRVHSEAQPLDAGSASVPTSFPVGARRACL